MAGLPNPKNYASHFPNPGLGNVGSYQISSIPYLTSSLNVPAVGDTPLVIEFYNVTRFVVITNTMPQGASASPLRFGFSEAGVKGTHYAVLNNNESFEAPFRVSRLYLLSHTASPSSGSVVAGLTGVEAETLKNNWSGSAGVG